MKDSARLVVSHIASNDAAEEKIEVYVNDVLMGDYRVHPGMAVVEQGLILAGFERVDVSGAGLNASSLSRDTLLKWRTALRARVTGALTGHRGVVHLKKFWPEAFDECRFDIFINDVGAWSWALPALNIETLATVLREAAFNVEVVREQDVLEQPLPLAA